MKANHLWRFIEHLIELLLEKHQNPVWESDKWKITLQLIMALIGIPLFIYFGKYYRSEQ